MDNRSDEKEKQKNRIIIYIVILIIILLSLITSCSCTSKFFGKIGDLFKNEGTFILDDTGSQEIISNQELKFDKNTLTISLSDVKTKLSYTYKNINPDGLTCTTSDADIATCYVENGYVVINPKKVGTVTITLQGNANGKIYEATAIVNVTEAKKKLELASKSGTINLYYTNKKIVAYNLIGISGDIQVTSSDKSVATATIKNGVIQIKALKPGKAEITLSVSYNGTIYTATYKLTVINKAPTSGSTGGNDSVKPGTDGNTTGGEKPSDTKDTNNYLSVLAGKENASGKTYNLKEEFVKTDSDKSYTIDVPYNEKTISLIATKESEKSTITYTLTNKKYPNGKPLTNLDDISLASGDNVIKIVVTAENGSQREYTVVIHKPIRTIAIDDDIYNINISVGKYTIGYQVLDDDNTVESYNVDDIELSKDFEGIVTLEKGKIILIPNESMIDKDGNINLTIKDNKESDSTKVHVNFDYYIGGENQVKKYDISYSDADDNSKTIIINTNLFSSDSKENGVDWSYDSASKTLLICSKTNKSKCINIVATGDITSLAYQSGSGEDSLAIIVNGNVNENGEGSGQLTVSGSAYGKEVPDSFDIEISIHQIFNVTISANKEKYGEKVFFGNASRDEFGNITKLIKKTEIVDGKLQYLQEQEKLVSGIGENIIKLSEYEAYLEKDGCEYYPVERFNTKPDGTGKSYTIDEVISLENKNLVKDLKLYAIYSDIPVKVTGTIERESFEYLTFEDDKEITNVSQHLFYNKDFAKYYGENANDEMKKVIYPGVAGIYDMYFVNDNDILKTITGLKLEETDTICVSEKGVKGCLSMAYSVLYKDKAFYGTESRYELLNKGKKGALANITLPDIPLMGKKTTSDEIGIQLKWKWVEEEEGYKTSDVLDTLIGNKAAASATNTSINDLYKLRVGVRYTIEENQCK